MNKLIPLISSLVVMVFSFSCSASDYDNIKKRLLSKPSLNNNSTSGSAGINVNGDIEVDDNPNSMPQIVVSDLPEGAIEVTRNTIPNKSHDMDFFKLNGNWYKIKTGTAIISTDSHGKTTVKSVSLLFDRLFDGRASPTVYNIQSPTKYWLKKDGPYEAHDYLNDLVSQGLLKPEEFIDPRNLDGGSP